MAAVVLLATLATIAHAQDGFTITNGQIFTNGLVIVDSPQPNTPMGGDTLQVALDISGNGRLQQPPYAPNVETGLFNITMFLWSYTTGLNLTISNGTRAGWNDDTDEDNTWACDPENDGQQQAAGCQSILSQESGSTVKHVDLVWPDCLAGDGGADNGECQAGGDIEDCLLGTARGPYNVSIHQTFRLNGTDFYTMFDLPIQVTNSIPEKSSFGADSDEKVDRPLCAARNNRLLSPEVQSSSTTPIDVAPWIGDGGDVQGTNSPGGNNGNGGENNGNGGDNNGSRGDNNGNGGDNNGSGGDDNGNGGAGDGGSSGGGGTSPGGNGNNGGNSGDLTPSICATIDSVPVSCTEAPQTGISLTNLVPNFGSRYTPSRLGLGSAFMIMSFVSGL